MLLWEVCKAKGKEKEVDTDRPELKSIHSFFHSSIRAFIYLTSVCYIQTPRKQSTKRSRTKIPCLSTLLSSRSCPHRQDGQHPGEEGRSHRYRLAGEKVIGTGGTAGHCW